MHELKKKAFFGIVWSGGNRIFGEFAALVKRLVLARLLIPEEFGIVSMAFIVLSVINILRSVGIAGAFIRDNESEPLRAKNTLFYLSTISIVIVSALGFFLAPLGANFFADKITDQATIHTLMWVIRVIALSYLIKIIAVVPDTILSKELRVKQAVVSGVVSQSVGLVITLVLAYLGFGVWSLIIPSPIISLISGLISFKFEPFIPSAVFDKMIAKSYLSYGLNSFFTSIMNVIIQQGDDAIIGRVVGPAAIAFYTMGGHFAGLASSLISGLIKGVLFPVLSKLQDSKEAFSRAYFKVFRLSNTFSIPGIAGAALLAPEIVETVLGPNWLPIVPVFYFLAVAALLADMVAGAGAVLNTMNKPQILRNNRFMQMGLFVLLVYPFAKLWGLRGVTGVMILFPIVSIIHLFPHLSKYIDGLYSNLFKIMSKILFATVIMTISVLLIKKGLFMLFSVNIFWLILISSIGATLYFVIIFILDKKLKFEFREASFLLMEKIPNENLRNKIILLFNKIPLIGAN